MKPERVEYALIECAKLFGAFGNYRGRAAGFASMSLQELEALSRPSALLAKIRDADIRPAQASTSLVAPDRATVLCHVKWMSAQIETLGSFNKKCRWVGFLQGALSCCGMDEGRSRAAHDEDAIFLLLAPARQSHYSAHLALGFMQGMLWAKGYRSIDQLRFMNNPQVMAA